MLKASFVYKLYLIENFENAFKNFECLKTSLVTAEILHFLPFFLNSQQTSIFL